MSRSIRNFIPVDLRGSRHRSRGGALAVACRRDFRSPERRHHRGRAAEPADAGGATRLRFRVENASGRTVVLEDIRSPDAAEGALVVSGGDGAQPAAAGLLLLDQETLDLGTSHLGAELRGLRRALRDGDIIEFEAVFRTGAAPARAHVHAEGD